MVIAALGDQASEDDMKALYLIAPVFALVANPVSAQMSRAEANTKPMVMAMAQPCENGGANQETRKVAASISEDEGEKILQRLSEVSPASITTQGQLMELIGNDELLMAAAKQTDIDVDKDQPRRKINWREVLRIIVIVLDAVLNP